MPVRHGPINERWRFCAGKQQHLACLHFQDLIGSHKLLALLSGGSFAAFAEFGGRLFGAGEDGPVAKGVRCPIGGFKLGAAKAEYAGSDAGAENAGGVAFAVAPG